MRRVSILFLMILSFSAVFAQDKSASELKNEGNAALRAKDYAKAIELYEKALAGMEEEDGAMVYNLGICSMKTKKYDKAKEYFNKTIELEYKKASTAFLYMSLIYKKAKDDENYVKVLSDGLVKFPTHKKLKKSLAIFYVKKAQKEYNAGATIQKTAATPAYHIIGNTLGVA